MLSIHKPSAAPAEASNAPESATDTVVDSAGGARRYVRTASVGTGARPGSVRTRTVRSNTHRALLRLREDRGAATAEYIVATMAAVGFAGLLIVILRGDEVRGILTELVRSALTVG
ncbi:DUF4244 domain-containing protein [Cryobacterium adonitolivorans]|uniref:DUF4244 domain-containing protein n=1 Tax=Cryobacterium adonitolivorans TaxID=1259189 RepID=A0A4R8WDX4_9MICO|nr:DUF4244 domain-containing protein [Cryobacterium adonitolivorans]